jgi:hypothetical protein
MPHEPAGLSLDTLQDQLEASTTSSSRLLFVLVAASITVAYLGAAALGWLRPFERAPVIDASSTGSHLEADIRSLEPVLVLSDRLLADRELVQRYREYIRLFVALDNAATRELRGANRTSAAFRSIDPIEIERANDVSTGLGQLEVDLDMYSADNLRTAGLGAFEAFNRLFVKPERTLNNAALIQQLQADAKIVRALSPGSSVPTDWPGSLYFRDFARLSHASSGVLAALELARAIPEPDSIVDRLIEYGSRSSVTPLSIAALKRHLRSGEFIVASDSSSVEKIQVSFLPVGVNRNVLLVCSPLALLFILSLLGSQLERRAKLVASLRGHLDTESLSILSSQWFVTRAVAGPVPQSRVDQASRVLLLSYGFAGHLSPIVAQMVVLIFLARLPLSPSIASLFWASSVVCGAASIVLVWRMIQGQLAEVIGHRRPRSKRHLSA